MHVAVDGIGNHAGGGWSVLRRTIREIARDSRVERLTVFCSSLQSLPGDIPRHDGVHWCPRPREQASRRARLAWYALGLGLESARQEADVVLCMNGMGRTRLPRVNVVQQAFTVHGRLRSLRPRSFGMKQAAIRRHTAWSCREADALVVQTDWMRSAAIERFDRGDVYVLPLGLPRPVDARPPGPGARPKRTMVCVTNGLPYKQTDVAVRSFEQLRGEFGDLALRLTLEEATVNASSRLESNPSPEEQEKVAVGKMEPSDIAELLGRAALLIAPSRVESFGLPVVEAFANRCPVVAADRPWCRSVADNAVLFFDDRSAESAAEQAAEVLRNDELAADLARRGSRRLQELWATDPYRRLVDLLAEVA